jgi:hypothetical protein
MLERRLASSESGNDHNDTEVGSAAPDPSNEDVAFHTLIYQGEYGPINSRYGIAIPYLLFIGSSSMAPKQCSERSVPFNR